MADAGRLNLFCLLIALVFGGRILRLSKPIKIALSN